MDPEESITKRMFRTEAEKAMASERVRRPFAEMYQLQAEQEERRRQEREERATRAYNQAMSFLGDVNQRINAPDDVVAKFTAQGQLGAKELGLEFADPDPVPGHMAATFFKLKTDPASRALPPLERLQYMKSTFGSWWFRAKQEFTDQVKLSGLQAEETEKREGEKPKVKVTPAKLTPTGGEGGISLEPGKPAEVPKTQEEMEADALFGDAYDPLSIEDLGHAATLMKNPEAIPLYMENSRTREIPHRLGLSKGIPESLWQSDPNKFAGLTVDKFREAEQLKNKAKLIPAIAPYLREARLSIAAGAPAEEVAAAIGGLIGDLYEGADEDILDYVRKMPAISPGQELGIDREKGLRLRAELKDARDWLLELINRDVDPSHPEYQKTQRRIDYALSELTTPLKVPGAAPTVTKTKPTVTETKELPVLPPMPLYIMRDGEDEPTGPLVGGGRIPAQTVTQAGAAARGEAAGVRAERRLTTQEENTLRKELAGLEKEEFELRQDLNLGRIKAGNKYVNLPPEQETIRRSHLQGLTTRITEIKGQLGIKPARWYDEAEAKSFLNDWAKDESINGQMAAGKVRRFLRGNTDLKGQALEDEVERLMDAYFWGQGKGFLRGKRPEPGAHRKRKR